MSLVPAFEVGVWNAWIFMVWLLIQNLVIMANKKLYQRFEGASDTKPSQEDKILNILCTLLWLLSTVYSIFLPLKLGTAWFPIGLVIFLLGLATLTIATINFATTPIGAPVTGGIYRYSRHPAYAALVLIYLGVGIASASWIFLLVTMMWVVLLGISARDEERYCLEKYGPAYRDYLDGTPRWLGIPKATKSR
jgi:protein-S-isoprenylcysteine O-methyltransferase Ste14